MILSFKISKFQTTNKSKWRGRWWAFAWRSRRSVLTQRDGLYAGVINSAVCFNESKRMQQTRECFIWRSLENTIHRAKSTGGSSRESKKGSLSNSELLLSRLQKYSECTICILLSLAIAQRFTHRHSHGLRCTELLNIISKIFKWWSQRQNAALNLRCVLVRRRQATACAPVDSVCVWFKRDAWRSGN